MRSMNYKNLNSEIETEKTDEGHKPKRVSMNYKNLNSEIETDCDDDDLSGDGVSL